jgi:hypothetical protein
VKSSVRNINEKKKREGERKKERKKEKKKRTERNWFIIRREQTRLIFV